MMRDDLDQQLKKLLHAQREDDRRRSPAFRTLLARERPSAWRASLIPALAGLAGAAALVLLAVRTSQKVNGPVSNPDGLVVIVAESDPDIEHRTGEQRTSSRLFDRGLWSSTTDFLLASSGRELLTDEPARSVLDLAVLPDFSADWSGSRIQIPSIERSWNPDSRNKPWS